MQPPDLAQIVRVVAGQAARQLGAVGGDDAYGLARAEVALDGDDAAGEQAAALLDERAARAVVDDEAAGGLGPVRDPVLARRQLAAALGPDEERSHVGAGEDVEEDARL